MPTPLEYAKTFCTYDTATLDSKLTQALVPATTHFKNLLGNESYERYLNISTAINITSFEVGSDDKKTKCNCEDLRYLNGNDLITITSTSYSGTYAIYNLDIENNTFEINKTFIIDETGTFLIDTLENYKQGFAFLILYYTTFTAEEIFSKKISVSSQQFGQGQVTKSFNVRSIRAEYLQKAKSLIGTTATSGFGLFII